MCKLEPMFQYVFRHLFKILDTMFQHTGTVQCAWVHAYLYARPLLFKETIFPYLIDQATHISLQNQLWNISKVVFYFRKYLLLVGTILKMFRHFRTFHICF